MPLESAALPNTHPSDVPFDELVQEHLDSQRFDAVIDIGYQRAHAVEFMLKMAHALDIDMMDKAASAVSRSDAVPLKTTHALDIEVNKPSPPDASGAVPFALATFDSYVALNRGNNMFADRVLERTAIVCMGIAYKVLGWPLDRGHLYIEMYTKLLDTAQRHNVRFGYLGAPAKRRRDGTIRLPKKDDLVLDECNVLQAVCAGPHRSTRTPEQQPPALAAPCAHAEQQPRAPAPSRPRLRTHVCVCVFARRPCVHTRTAQLPPPRPHASRLPQHPVGGRGRDGADEAEHRRPPPRRPLMRPRHALAASQ